MMWKLISVLLGLTAFIVVCISSMLSGDELLTSTLKAIASFVVLWVFFSLVGAIFTRVVSNGEEDESMQQIFASQVEKTTRSIDQTRQPVEKANLFVEKTNQPYVSGIDEDNLPSIEAGPELGKAA